MDKITLIACSVFGKELNEIINSNNYQNVSVVASHYDCGTITNTNKKQCNKLTTGSFDCSNCIPLHKNCLSQTCASCCHKNTYTPTDQCLTLLLNKELIDFYINKGYYIVSAGWLNVWQSYVKDLWGFNHHTAKIFFKDSASKILILDTGLYDNITEEAEKFSGFVGLETEIIPVGIDLLKKNIENIVKKSHIEELKKEIGTTKSDLQKQLANNFLFYDFIKRISNFKAEEYLIADILNLCNMLFAPKKLNYISVKENGELKYFYPQEENDNNGYQLNFKEDFKKTESGNGFLLKFSYDSQTYGYLIIDDLAFPKHLDRYLFTIQIIQKGMSMFMANIKHLSALNTAKEKAERSTDIIENQKEELEAANEELNASNDALRQMNIELFKKQKTIEESELFYREILSNISDTVFITDFDDNFTFICPNVHFNLGYSSKEVASMQKASNLISALANIDRKKLLKENEIKNWECTATDKQGIKHTFLVSVKIIDIFKKEILYSCRDITKKKVAKLELILAKEKAEENEKRFKDFTFSIGDWVWEVDENGKYTYSSQKGSDFLGEPNEDLIGKSPFDFTPPEEALSVGRIFSKIEAKKSPIKDMENWIINKKGELICLLTNGVPILDKNGNYKGFRGIDKDITKRKEAEHELKIAKEKAEESELLLRESQKVGYTGSYYFDFKTQLWTSSESLDQIFGITPEFNKSIDGWLNVVHPDDREMMQTYFMKEVIQKKKKFEKEYRIIRRSDNKTRWVYGFGKVSCKDENLVSMYGVIQDITERKLTEEALKESEEKFRNIVEATNSLITKVDINGIFTYVNSISEYIYGLKPEECIGKSAFDFVFSEDREKTIIEFKKWLLTEKTHMEFENRQVSTNGEIHHINWYIHKNYNMNGVLIGFSSVSNDITALRKREEELEIANKDLKETMTHLKETQVKLLHSEKMASLGTLTSGVAHEINNPLNYIMGAHMGLDRYFKEHGSFNKKKTDFFLSSMLIGIERVSGIVKGLNQFSRSDEIMDETCNIHTIIDNCLTMLQYKFNENTILEKKYAESNISVKGNIGMLHQVFVNIISNAIYAIEQKGDIKIETKIQNNKSEIVIIDTGIGIEKQNLSQITDPFYTTKPPGEGTGLGLSITHSLIKEHKGSINFWSEKGVGTKVTIVLPIIN